MWSFTGSNAIGRSLDSSYPSVLTCFSTLSWFITLTSPSDAGKVLTIGGPATQNPLTLIIFGKLIKKESRKKREEHIFNAFILITEVFKIHVLTHIDIFSMKICLLVKAQNLLSILNILQVHVIVCPCLISWVLTLAADMIIFTISSHSYL